MLNISDSVTRCFRIVRRVKIPGHRRSSFIRIAVLGVRESNSFAPLAILKRERARLVLILIILNASSTDATQCPIKDLLRLDRCLRLADRYVY